MRGHFLKLLIWEMRFLNLLFRIWSCNIKIASHNWKSPLCIYPINSKITRGLNFFFLPKIAGYFRVRIIFECGLNSFFLFFLTRNKCLFVDQKEFIMVISLSAVVRVSKYSKSLSQNSDTPANAVNICKIHKIFSDNNRVRIKIECGLNSFFLPKIADYNRVRIIIECGLFSS